MIICFGKSLNGVKRIVLILILVLRVIIFFLIYASLLITIIMFYLGMKMVELMNIYEKNLQ